MPNPKSGTVTMDVARAVTETKAGKVEYRVDKTSIVHVPTAKSPSVRQALENYNVLMEASSAKPAAKRPHTSRA